MLRTLKNKLYPAFIITSAVLGGAYATTVYVGGGSQYELYPIQKFAAGFVIYGSFAALFPFALAVALPLVVFEQSLIVLVKVKERQ